MPKTSAFTPPGHFAFSSRPSHGESIFRTLRDNFGDTFDTSSTSLQQARLYAQAMCLASSQYQLDRAANNRSPARATELLGLLEQDYQVTPPSKATLTQRRTFLAALQRVTRGNRREAIEDALRTLLGTDFIEYRTTQKTNIVQTPTASTVQNVSVFAARGAKKKVFSVPAIVTTRVPFTVNYSSIGGTDAPLAGEQYCFDPDPRRALEQVTILAADQNTITAVFMRAHEAGTLAVRPHPYWISNQRFSCVVVTQAAAIDPEKRRKINTLMSRALRGVSQWAVITNMGVFTPTVDGSRDPNGLDMPDSVPVL